MKKILLVFTVLLSAYCSSDPVPVEETPQIDIIGQWFWQDSSGDYITFNSDNTFIQGGTLGVSATGTYTLTGTELVLTFTTTIGSCTGLKHNIALNGSTLTLTGVENYGCAGVPLSATLSK